jgi:hypothetical protein
MHSTFRVVSSFEGVLLEVARRCSSAVGRPHTDASGCLTRL